MESCSRGQLPAWHTKAVDESQRPLKTGFLGSGVCSNDVKSSKPCVLTQGRDLTLRLGVYVSVYVVVVVSAKHVIISWKEVRLPVMLHANSTMYVVQEISMNCGTKNVIYLISCRKCGVQYVGEMSQALRSAIAFLCMIENIPELAFLNDLLHF